jgi:hypothetical protein
MVGCKGGPRGDCWCLGPAFGEKQREPEFGMTAGAQLSASAACPRAGKGFVGCGGGARLACVEVRACGPLGQAGTSSIWAVVHAREAGLRAGPQLLLGPNALPLFFLFSKPFSISNSISFTPWLLCAHTCMPSIYTPLGVVY